MGVKKNQNYRFYSEIIAYMQIYQVWQYNNTKLTLLIPNSVKFLYHVHSIASRRVFVFFVENTPYFIIR